MQEILKKQHYRLSFYFIAGLIILLTICTRFFILPYFDETLSVSFMAFLSLLLNSLLVSLIVTIFIGSFVFWLTPEIIKRSVMEVVEPKEIGKLLKKASLDSRTWIFKGAAGRYTRAVTIPAMAEAARHGGIGRDIRLCLIDPADEKLCDEYATYRRSLKSAKASTPWDSTKVRNEVVATIVSTLITKHEEPLLRIEIHLINHFSAFRLDISDYYVVVTKEDKEAAGLRADSGTYFYDSYIDDVRLTERQSKKVIFDDMTKIISRDAYDKDKLRAFIEDIKILSNADIQLLNLDAILKSIQDFKNPYAN